MPLNSTDYRWLESWFRYLDSKLNLLLKTLNEDYVVMDQELNNVLQQLQAMESAEQSAITLLQTLSQQIAQNANNPTVIQQIAKRLQVDAANMAAAVVQYTPQVTTEAPVTTEPPATTTTEDPSASSTTPLPETSTTPAP